MNYSNLLDDLLLLQTRYQNVVRADITLDRYSRNLEHIKNREDITAILLRETLIEHVGHLPIIATFIFPKLENVLNIDLGKVLTMLAIHDIGETIKGDIFSFNKTKEEEEDEDEIALNLLDDPLKNVLIDFLNKNSLESKFAKSVDVLSPKLHHLTHPETTKLLFKHYNFNAESIRKKQLKLFEWDSTLFGIFNEVLKRLEQI